MVGHSIRKSGRLELEARLMEPLHHGAGVSGNTQLIRTQRIYNPTFERIMRLPYISGNSFKHMIRVGATKFALEAMAIEDGSLTKPVVHLLFSGGALGKKGSTVKISRARELEKLFPALSMCGYSAANNMPPSKLKVDHFHLVCVENVFRMPSHLQKSSESKKRMAEFRSEEFGTRHEPTRLDYVAQRMLASGELEADQKALSLAAEKVDAGIARKKQAGTAQMLYEFETMVTGSLWWGGLWFDELTELELAALKSGLAYMARGKCNDGVIFMLGAKSSVGFGRMSIKFAGALREICIPQYQETDLFVPNDSTELKSYVNHLRTNRDSIMELLKTVA